MFYLYANKFVVPAHESARHEFMAFVLNGDETPFKKVSREEIPEGFKVYNQLYTLEIEYRKYCRERSISLPRI